MSYTPEQKYLTTSVSQLSTILCTFLVNRENRYIFFSFFLPLSEIVSWMKKQTTECTLEAWTCISASRKSAVPLLEPHPALAASGLHTKSSFRSQIQECRVELVILNHFLSFRAPPSDITMGKDQSRARSSIIHRISQLPLGGGVFIFSQCLVHIPPAPLFVFFLLCCFP